VSNRFVFDEDGLRWDRITALDIEVPTREGPRPTISITGIMNGKDGALLLHLPGMVPRYYALQPDEARAMRDAMVARHGRPRAAREDGGLTWR
jgi:hypothetical protein